MYPHALSIAGSDSSGGAGIQADLKTWSALGVYGMTAITAVTAQNTVGVQAIYKIPLDCIRAQIDSVFSDIRVDAVKIGMLGDAEIIMTVVEALKRWKPAIIVLDPVMVAKSGDHLLEPAAVKALCTQLLPLASVVTPNLPEAEVMTGQKTGDLAAMKDAAATILTMGAKAIVVKGGHLDGQAIDVLMTATDCIELPAPRLDARHTHGTGCTLSAAITANLVKGMPLTDAVRAAKTYTANAISHGIALGHGIGPTHHFYAIWKDHQS
jgi:hydroxymethylpyrimidine/phosphomethylpyrimidine kinase